MRTTLYDFCINNEEKKYLLDEWDYTKNQKTPKDVTTAIKEKSWWICEKGHSYESHIYSRIQNNTGCPYCSGRLPIKGENDLYTTHPHLLEEWDFNKNTIKPDEVSAGSGQPVWWRCNNGHSYNQRISSHIGRNLRCPYCSGKKTLEGYNDLTTWCKQNNKQYLLEEWDYEKNTIKPTEVTRASNKPIWWKCYKGHEWKVSVSDRTNGSNCPYCGERRLLKGYNDLKTWCEENNKQYLLEEWDYSKNTKKPEDYPRSHKDSVWWICKEGHEWQARIGNRAVLGRNCPYCNDHKVLKGYNDLKSWCIKNDKQYLLEEWDYEKNDILPDQISQYNSTKGKKIWWKCKSGHSWKTSIAHRTIDNTGCPYCFSERQTSFSEQAIYYYIKQAFPDAENSYNIGNRFKLDIFIPSLSVGIEYDGSAWHKNTDKDIRKNELCKIKKIHLIRVREEGCPEMSNDSFLTIVNCKAIDIKKYIYDLDGSIKNIFNILEQLSKTKITINVDTEKDKINIFSTYKQNKYEKSLAFLRPDLLEEWDYEANKGIDPSTFTLGSQVQVWWKCKEGHSYQTFISTRTKTKIGCPYCTSQKMKEGYNDLKTWCIKNNKQYLLEEWDYKKNKLKPNEVKSNGTQKIHWKCRTCGKEWETPVNLRTGKSNAGCPNCAIIERAKKKSKKVKNLDTGEIFNSLTEAAKYCNHSKGTTISNCCKGKTKTAGGYRWEFYNE